MIEYMLTTEDNPFSPFDEYDAWFAFDLRSGYRTPQYLARVVVTSDDLSEADQKLAIDQAIDEIIRENITGNYKKVSREVPNFSYTSLLNEIEGEKLFPV